MSQRGATFMNDPENFMKESLEGHVIANPGVVMLSRHNVIAR